MTIDPVKIPQNVYVEDRIVGPLTLRQLIIMLVGGGLSYMLYTSLAKANGGHLGVIPTVLVWVPCAIATLFAIIKVNDLSLLRILLLMIEKTNKPARRQWTMRQGISIHIRTSSKEIEEEEKKKAEQKQAIAAAQHTQHRIEELSSVVDRPQTANIEAVAEAIEPTQENVNITQTTPTDTTPATRAPTFPVDPNRIKVDGRNQDDSHDDLSAYRGVFRDISPHP